MSDKDIKKRLNDKTKQQGDCASFLHTGNEKQAFFSHINTPFGLS